jgi:YD repeat-containing protein
LTRWGAGVGITTTKTDQLTSIIRQDGSVRRYHYEHAVIPHYLTGITDELGIRYATYSYNNEGKVQYEAGPNNITNVEINYKILEPKQTNVWLGTYGSYANDPRLMEYKYSGDKGLLHTTQITDSKSANKVNKTYTDKGLLSTETTFDGKYIYYTYDTKLRQTSRTERLGSASGVIANKTTVVYHLNFNLPTLTTEPNRNTAIHHDAKGNIIGYVDYITNDPTGVLMNTAPVISSQSTGWTYNTKQLPDTARHTETIGADISPASSFGFSYDTLGNLTQFTQSIQGAAIETGNLTTYNRNGAFLAGTSTTAQSIINIYNKRGQLTATNVAGAITIYTYDLIGQNKQTKHPNGDSLDYTYDAAHKLTSIKWNGIEQYAITGLSNKIASLVGYSGIKNPDLAFKLGIKASVLDTIDNIPVIVTEKTNTATSVAMELAKEALIGSEVQAQIVILPRITPPPSIAGGTIVWGFPNVAMVEAGFTIDTQGYIRNMENQRICLPDRDPVECNKLKKVVDASKSNVGRCKGNDTTADLIRKLRSWRDEYSARTIYQCKCYIVGHEGAIEQAKVNVENCEKFLKVQ